jgi:hypothetical protein
MDIREYKSRTIELTFPSGLVLTCRPPKVKALMDIALSGEDPVVIDAQMLLELAKGFPEEFTLDDITDPRDWAYLREWLQGFFGQTSPATSSGSSETGTSPRDSGPTTS